MRDALVDPAPEEVDVGDEEVVADELHAAAEPVGQRLPARPSRTPRARPRSRRSGSGRRGRPRGRSSRACRACRPGARAWYAPVAVAARSSPGRARAPPCRGARPARRPRGSPRRRRTAEPRSGANPPSSPTAVARPRSCEQPLEMVVRLGADPERLGERLGAGGDDHELLEVERVLRVRAAVDDVHQRDGQHVRVRRRRSSGRAARPRRRPRPSRRRATRRGSRSRRAAPSSACRRARSSARSIARWSPASRPDERVGDLAVDVRDRPRDALAEPRVAAVAQLDRLVLAGRGARRHGRAPERAGLEPDLDLDRRVSPRVEHLPAVDVDDRCVLRSRGEH